MGQLRKRGRIWWIRYYRNGQRIEESTGFDKYDKARDLLKTREGEIAKGAHITPASTRFTFDDAVKDVQADYTVNGKKSGDDVERRLRLHLTPVFGGRRMSTIGTSDLRAFSAARLEAGASPAEINRELSIVRRRSGSRSRARSITVACRRFLCCRSVTCGRDLLMTR